MYFVRFRISSCDTDIHSDSNCNVNSFDAELAHFIYSYFLFLLVMGYMVFTLI